MRSLLLSLALASQFPIPNAQLPIASLWTLGVGRWELGVGSWELLQIPQQRPASSSIQGVVLDQGGRGIPAVEVVLRQGTREVARTTTSGDGSFRILAVVPGEYVIALRRDGYSSVEQGGLRVAASELVSVELKMNGGPPGSIEKRIDPGPPTPYGTVVRPREGRYEGEGVPLQPGDKVFLPVPDRWNLPLPEWERYGGRGDYPYVSGHWWDPYNQNRLKGDYPILGQRTFFVFTGVSDSLLEGRNVPVPSGVSTERPGSERFFGRGGV